MSLTLTDALAHTRTGDIWVFRGRTRADRAIQALTNSPVNHVGMTVALDDLPPLMWHAELGRSLPDVWTGDRHSGVQLHDLRSAVVRWQEKYHQQAWLRQLSPDVSRTEEDALLRVIARLNGVSFPSTGRLAWRWLRGRTTRAKALIGRRSAPDPLRPEVAYCAEVVALTFEEMGLLPEEYPVNWYDPGKFWSGDQLPLADGWTLGEEIAVATKDGQPGS
ncbi:MAG: hypothetical protein Q4G46_04000 [Propionibacteriaceae bacterium]|nr:hypothetical protein [Propionibacteriaceae bacterium]